MSQTTLSPAQRRNCVFARDLGAPMKMYESSRKNESDESVPTLVVEGKAIFRSGTFSDSEGVEHTWEPLHISQMVDHAAMLEQRGLFGDIPVRKGHRDWGGLFSSPARNAMDELVGYMSNLRSEDRVNPSDGNTYTYLLADLEIIEESAIKNIKTGLWRNVSAEISAYVTNGNAEYWPVMFGVAYVDIPAVEGLKSQHSKAADQFSIILEDNMAPEPKTPSVEDDKSKSTDHSKNPGAPAPAAPFAFSIGGKTVTDYAAVQKQIADYETQISDLKNFEAETIEAGKSAFVKGLVESNKIPAASEEAYVNYAKTLSGAQYEAWKALEESKPAMQLTAHQAGGFSTSHDQSHEQSERDLRIETLQGIVAQHSANPKMSRETILETASYKELKSLVPEFTL